jgi:sugar O-acyltransferase (sialic acid O-acetyltransferase NeuD family)
MEKYIVLGTGHFLNDLFDIVHANDGLIYKVYQDLPEVPVDRTNSIAEKLAFLVYDVQYLSSIDSFFPEDGCRYVLGCTVPQKHRLVDVIKKRFGLEFSSLVHPHAYLGSNVEVQEGVVVSPGVIIGPNTTLKRFSMLNRGACLGHYVTLGEYARVGPSAVISGFCEVGDKVSIGVGAVLSDRLKVGRWSVVGAGALVMKDVPEEVIVYGVPARVVRANEAAREDG